VQATPHHVTDYMPFLEFSVKNFQSLYVTLAHYSHLQYKCPFCTTVLEKVFFWCSDAKLF